jgi:hypothetical protein
MSVHQVDSALNYASINLEINSSFQEGAHSPVENCPNIMNDFSWHPIKAEIVDA